MRRKAYKTKEEKRKAVEMMVVCGISPEKIASFLGMPVERLEKMFRWELETASTRAQTAIAQKMYQAAAEGNMKAMQFGLRHRAQWGDGTGSRDVMGPVSMESAREKLAALLNRRAEAQREASEDPSCNETRATMLGKFDRAA